PPPASPGTPPTSRADFAWGETAPSASSIPPPPASPGTPPTSRGRDCSVCSVHPPSPGFAGHSPDFAGERLLRLLRPSPSPGFAGYSPDFAGESPVKWASPPSGAWGPGGGRPGAACRSVVAGAAGAVGAGPEQPRSHARAAGPCPLCSPE